MDKSLQLLYVVLGGGLLWVFHFDGDGETVRGVPLAPSQWKHTA